MTEPKTNLYRKGSRCQVCTGCGRCFGSKKMDVVSGFFLDEAELNESHTAAGPQDKPDREAGMPQDGTGGDCMIAADIGTTTIAMQLRSLADGKVLDTFTCVNPQQSYGADVLSRIEAAEQPGEKEAMTEAVRGVLDKGIRQFAGRLKELQPEAEILGMAIAANTTMVHLLMGYDVSRLGKYPFLPETLSEIRTELLGLDTVVLPGASAFIGADIVAGIYALSMQEREEVTLLLDLGTNGEMVLGNRERLIAAGTAAGPAFEGNGSYYGTDLMELAAKLLEEGILDTTGLLADLYFESGIDIGGVHITQQYIRQLQMAKSAICAGIRILCKKYGLKDFAGIDKVWLAGGMGRYLNPHAAAAIGLIPQELAERTAAVGNSALRGAFVYGRKRFLLQPEAGAGQPERAACTDGTVPGETAAPQVEVFNLAEEPEFAENYISGMELEPCVSSI